MNKIKEYTEKVFEDIKHIDELGNEYWYARELQKVLGYHQWRSINDLIERAKVACKESKYNIDDHFAVQRKMVDIGSNTKREVQDYKLSRYACYLIVMNGNPIKEIIALAQTYFAIQTRKQELSEKKYNELTEDEKRLYRRNQARKGNYNLNKTAVNSGVKDLARFHNAGYKGLYNGETADDIFKRKKLRYREDILDNMGSEELADNIFRIAQTDAKLKRDNIDNEYTANSVHYEVGRKVRNTIKELGGTMPEDLPTPKTSLKELEKKKKHDIIITGCGNMFEQEINELENRELFDDYTILKGSIPVLFSAPHTMYQLRDDGTTKLKEPYTKAIALYLNKYCNTYAIVKNNDTGIDSNRDNYDQYNVEMRRLIKENNIKLVIDLHGASKDREFDIEFGTLYNLSADFSTIKELEEAFTENGINNINHNNPFKGGAITQGIYSLDDVDVIQIEINGKYRDYNNIKELENLIQSLQNFIKQYNEYINR